MINHFQLTDEMDFPLNKFSKILKILTSQLTNREKYDDKQQCEGEVCFKEIN